MVSTVEQNAKQEQQHHVRYFAIFMALCLCTIFSVILDLVSLPSIVLVTLVLALAAAKAFFVLTYFMHLKFEGNWKFLVLSPTVILALGLIVGLVPDIAMHYYTSNGEQAQLDGQRDAGTHGEDAGKH